MISANVERLAQDWHVLLKVTVPPVDRGKFRLLHDQWAKQWARLSYADQGEVSYLISIRKDP